MTTSRIDQFFWLTSAADLIRDNENEEALYKMVARRISASHGAPQDQRLAAIRFLAAKVKPLT